MSTGLIITLVVIVLLALLVAAVVLPRQRRAKERKLEQRRLKAQEHLEESKARAARAEAERAAAAQQAAQAQARRAEVEQEVAREEREAAERKRRADAEHAEAERLAEEARRLSPDIDVAGAPGDHRIQEPDTAYDEANREDRVHADREQRAAAYVADNPDTRTDDRIVTNDGVSTHDGRVDAAQDPDREVVVEDAKTRETIGHGKLGRLGRFRREHTTR